MEFLFSCFTQHLTRSLRSLPAIELNTRKEIPYLSAPMYYSIYLLLFRAQLYHSNASYNQVAWKVCR